MMSLADQREQWITARAKVSVLRARGLRVKAGRLGPHALLQVGAQRFGTRAAGQQRAEPVWEGQEAAFELAGFPESSAVLRVQVLQSALVGPDKLLGQTDIDLGQLYDDRSREKSQWFKLFGKPGKPEKDRGEILLDIQFLKGSMSASMFDLSNQDKSRSKIGKLKDKLRGKKKEGLSDSASAVVPSVTQVMTDSEGEGEEETPSGEKKKKNKLKSLFAPKSNLQKNTSQSMSTLSPLSERDSAIASSTSSGLNVESPEGKKKFKFLMHKRNSSTDSKASQSGSISSHSVPPVISINGRHVYSQEPETRGSTHSLNSSGHGSMEELKRDGEQLEEEKRRRETEERIRAEEERLRKEEQQRRKIDEENGMRRMEQEKEQRKAEEDRNRKEEKERMRMEKEKEEQRRKIEEESKEREAEERRKEMERMRMEKEKEEQRRRAEEDRKRKEREEEEKVRIRVEEEKEVQRRKMEEEKKIKMEEERKRKEREDEERRKIEAEKERIRMEQEKKEQSRKMEEEKIKMEEERKRKEREEEERRKIEAEKERIRMEQEKEQSRKMEEERKEREAEERRKMEEEKEKIRMEQEKEEQRRKMEEEQNRKVREEKEKRRLEEEKRVKEERLREEKKKIEEKREREEDERRRSVAEEEKAERQREEEKRVSEERKKKEEEKEKERLMEEERRRMEMEERKRKERWLKEEDHLQKMEARQEQRPVPKARSHKTATEPEEPKEERAPEATSSDPFELSFPEEPSSTNPFEEPNTSSPSVHSARVSAVKPSAPNSGHLENIPMMNTNPFLDDDDDDPDNGSLEILSNFERNTETTDKKGRAPLPPLNKPKMPRLDVPSRDPKEVSKRPAPLPPGSLRKTSKELGMDMSTIAVDQEEPEKWQTSRIKPISKDELKAWCVQSMKARQMDPNSDQSVLKQNTSAQVLQSSQSQSSKKRADTNVLPCGGPVPVKHNKGPAPAKPSDTRGSNRKSVSELSIHSVTGGTVHPEETADVFLRSDSKESPSNLKAVREPKCLAHEDAKIELISPADLAKEEETSERLNKVDQPKSLIFVFKPDTLPDVDNLATESATLPGIAKKKFQAPLPPAKPKRVGFSANQQLSLPKTLNKANLGELPKSQRNKDQDEVQNTTSVSPLSPSSTFSLLAEKSEVKKACASMSADAGSASGLRALPCARVIPTDAQNSAGELKGAGGAPASVIRPHAVKPLNAADKQTDFSSKAAGATDSMQLKTEAAEAVCKGPYSQLTRAELVALVVRQQEQLSQRDFRIAELEQYIDNLLVRVMEEQPSILMSITSQKKAV